MSCGNTFQRKHLFIDKVLPSVDKDNATAQLVKHFPGIGKHWKYLPLSSLQELPSLKCLGYNHGKEWNKLIMMIRHTAMTS